MSVLSPSADFVYGNTRLRARKAALLESDTYETLMGRDLEGLLEASPTRPIALRLKPHALAQLANASSTRPCGSTLPAC